MQLQDGLFEGKRVKRTHGVHPGLNVPRGYVLPQKCEADWDKVNAVSVTVGLSHLERVS